MITRVVLGSNTEILNVSDVQEVVQNTGEYIKRALTINITKDEASQLPAVTSMEQLLRADDALSSIKIYKKDIVGTYEDGNPVYSDEYLESEHTGYSTIQSIVKHSDGGMISIVLIVDPTDIAADKAKQLEEENINIMIAAAEMHETMYTENTNLMLAIAELYEIMMGGVE